MRKNLAIIIFLLAGCSVFAQEKKRLSHNDYAIWNQIASPLISHDGRWVAYEVNPQDGDGVLVVRNLDTGFEEQIARAQNAAFSPGNQYLVFRIKPGKAVDRQAKVDKKKREEMPADSLGIYIFEGRQLVKHPALESFSLPRESSDWLSYVIDHDRLEKAEEETEETEETEDEKEKPGKVLYIVNPLTGHRLEVERINSYLVAEKGNLVAGFIEKKEKDTLSLWDVFVVELPDLQKKVLDSRRGEKKQLTMDKAGGQLTWMFSADTVASKVYDVYYFDNRRGRHEKIVYSGMPGMPEAFGVSGYSKPYFSDDGQQLFLATAPLPADEPEDTLLAEEKYSLDVWHWQDPMLQSQQKVMQKQLSERSFPAVYHFRQSKLVQLSDEDLPVIRMDAANNGAYALGENPVPYMIEWQWTGSNTRDLYVVRLSDGGRKPVAERVESSASISPGGNYVIWYDPDITSWKAYSIAHGTTADLAVGTGVAFYNENHDLPAAPRPHGVAGWTPGDREVLIYDRYDIWKVDPAGRTPAENVTRGYGREKRIVLRMQRLDRDEHFVRLSETVYLSGFDEAGRQSGFYSLNGGHLRQILMEDAALSGLQKAKHAERFLFTRSTFNIFPDLWTSGPDLSGAVKISDANPQQSEYYWGNVQLVEWKDFNNESLEGLIYFPEDLDESKTYPMLVYFYERSSNGLHQHAIPSPSRSTINRAYCTSNEYIVFIPDIVYTTGFPGESAYNAIVSGTKAMAGRYAFIDRDNMGLQGQSWGGYQIVYLITRTNMFKAAMAGAPVSNMISAYGGIRWQTGLNRQFQYEQTQSRIGGTLWEKPLRYIENSPIFFADKIETPLLMMHNDDDGAVPWYQGIELFTAMRRLSKPVWMLVYNGEAHNLTKWPNRMDLSVRMYQFFDHYLKGEPAPVWLKQGIPAVDKGKTNGYELTE